MSLVLPISSRRLAPVVLASLLVVASRGEAQTTGGTCQRWNVVVRMTEASAEVDALQVRIDYGDAAGVMVGNGIDVECVNLLPGDFEAFHNLATRTVTFGRIGLETFAAPVDLASCTFEAKPGQVPDPAQFELTVEDASGNGELVDVVVGVSLVAEGEPATCEAQCGDGLTDGFEECDDGNRKDTDACQNDCTLACGNGRLDVALGEECDDGNTSNRDACLADCVLATCGDGHVNREAERCDDGNENDGDQCPFDCQAWQECGDSSDDGHLRTNDALRILRRSVGHDDECATWACDVDGSGDVATTDALLVLRTAVDLAAPFACGVPAELVIRFETPQRLGLLEVEIYYSAAAAELPGNSVDVECEGNADATFEFRDFGTSLFLRVTAPFGWEPEPTLARCALVPSGPVDAHDFHPSIKKARAAAGGDATGVVVRAVPY